MGILKRRQWVSMVRPWAEGSPGSGSGAPGFGSACLGVAGVRVGLSPSVSSPQCRLGMVVIGVGLVG